MNNLKTHFQSLDGLRAIAALLVVFGHIELIKQQFGIPNYFEKGPFIFNLGDLSVTFFFVLSGFLITFLILKEEAINHTISLRNFYLRRILRIWPVYFLILLISLVIIPIDFSSILYSPEDVPNYSMNNFLFTQVFFLPNISETPNPWLFRFK